MSASTNMCEQIKNQISIADRPQIVDDKKRVGDCKQADCGDNC